MLIDTHCHLNDEKLIEREDAIVGSFGTNGIECAVCVGYDLPSSVLARDIASRHDSVYFAPGIHPHDSDTADDEKYAVIRELASDNKAVAIGEIGLDYHWMASTKQKNKIMAMASQKGLYDFNNPKDIKELECFCTSNGYDLKHLKFEEADEVLQLLIEYDPKVDDVTVDDDEIQDVEFNEVTETDESNIEGQVSLL